MLKTLLIADDSTGANASCILLNQLRFSTLSLIDYEKARLIDGYDAIAISTDSRGVDSITSHARVEKVLKKFENEEIPVINKRVDSTLRGNLGSELNSFHEVFPKRKIMIVPAYPSSGRICIGGDVYVNKTLLALTDVAKDPKMPINTSNAKELFLKQFHGEMDNIYLETVRDKKALNQKLKELSVKNDAIIFDAETNEDIERIAQVIAENNLDIITVDPGVFTYYYTKEKMSKEVIKEEKFIYLVGSVTDTTFHQMKRIENEEDFEIIPVHPMKLLDETLAKEEIIRAKEIAKESKKNFIVLTTVNPQNRIVLNLFDLSKSEGISVDDISKKINHQLSILLTETIKQTPKIGGVFCSGGDTALSFLSYNKAEGIRLMKEVLSLCVYGHVVSGDFDGLPIITKGGMIGSEFAYLQIRDFFKEIV